MVIKYTSAIGGTPRQTPFLDQLIPYPPTSGVVDQGRSPVVQLTHQSVVTEAGVFKLMLFENLWQPGS